jgi:hypothetical protein
MGLIYSQGVDLALSILILFYYIFWEKMKEFFFSPFFFDEFHSVEATLVFSESLLFVTQETR